MMYFTAVRRVWFMLMLCTGLFVPTYAFEAQVEELAKQIAAEAEGKQSIAVVDFTDLQGNVFELGRFLAEAFSVALANSGQNFELIDRTHLASIIREHKLSQTGLIDPKTAREIGRITGVQALVTGTLTPLGDNVHVTVKLLDTQSARILASKAGKIPRTGAIEELLRNQISFSRSGDGTQHPKEDELETSNISVEEKGIRFNLQKCTLSDRTLTCAFTVNSKKDVELTIYGESRVIVGGDQHNMSEGSLANQTGHYIFGGSYRVSEDLIAEIPARLVLAFEEVPADSRTISVLELSSGSQVKQGRMRVGTRFKVRLRDIPVVRQ